MTDAEFDNHQQQLDKVFYTLDKDHYVKEDVDGFIKELDYKCRKNFVLIETHDAGSKKM